MDADNANPTSKTKRRRRRRRRRQGNLQPLDVSIDQLLADRKYEAARNRLLVQPTLSDGDQRKLADCHFALDAVEEAIAALLDVRDKESYDEYRLGLFCYIAKQWTEAQRHLRRAIEGKPVVLRAYHWLALAIIGGQPTSRLSKADKQEVVELLFTACATRGNVPESFELVDDVCEWDADSSHLMSCLQYGVAEHPEADGIRFRLARHYIFDAQDFGAARETMAPLVSREAPAVEHLWAAIELERRSNDARSAFAHVERLQALSESQNQATCEPGLRQVGGELLLQLGKPKEAISWFEREIAAHQYSLVGAHCGRALGLLDCGEDTRAIEAARLAVNAWLTNGGFVELRIKTKEFSRKGCGSNFDTPVRLWDRLGSSSAHEASIVREELFYLIERGDVRRLSIANLRAVKKSLKHPIVDYDLSVKFASQRKPHAAVQAYLEYSFALYADGKLCELADKQLFFEAYECVQHLSHRIQTHKAIVAFLNADDRHRDQEFVDFIVMPLYQSFWRGVLFDGQMWKEAVQVTVFLCDACSLERPLFDKAYSLAANGQPVEAVAAYEEVLSLNPDNPAALNNLSLLLEKSDIARAASLAERALALKPASDLYVRRMEQLRTATANQGNRVTLCRLYEHMFDEMKEFPAG